MRAENMLNRRILGFQSIRGLYGWFRVVRSGLKGPKQVSFSNRLWCLRHGMAPDKMLLYGEQEIKKNYRDYLSDKQYYSIHPMNKEYSVYIDDKITMSYVFSKYIDYLPEYYFFIQKKGTYLRMNKCENSIPASAEGVVQVLEDKKKLAVKRMIGSGGVGFYCFEKRNDGYYVNNKQTSKEELIKLIEDLSSYLITEYVVNHREIRSVWSGSTNTMRMLVANLTGEKEDIVWMRSFIRYGNAKSNGVDNAHAGGIESIIDEDTGEVLFSVQQQKDGSLAKITSHPDSGLEFPAVIPHWDMVREVLTQICLDFPMMKYLGFDIAVTDDSFKIIEINSLSGLMASQARMPMLKDPKTRAVYEAFGLKIK